MRACHHIEIKTPKGVRLNGLWVGPKTARRVVIWVHGLGSSMFSKLPIADQLVGRDTAVLMFNNRGHDLVVRGKAGKAEQRFGAAHEKFTDCIDDIEGAIRFARRHGGKAIFLAGHSTGSQKVAYWAAKKGTGVRGIVLLAPVSDYAAAVQQHGSRTLKDAAAVASRYMRKGRVHELIPEGIWPWSLLSDAQRFLSLYSGISAEEIFTYWDTDRKPKTLRAIKNRTLVLLAEKDFFADRSARELKQWFDAHVRAPHETVIIRGADHGFKRKEKIVATQIKEFMKES